MDLNPRSLAHLYKRIGAGPHHEEIRLAEDVQRRCTDRRVEERREGRVERFEAAHKYAEFTSDVRREWEGPQRFVGTDNGFCGATKPG